MHRQPHSPYYRDRDSEYDLCNDFPGDEILIYGLHAMQSHSADGNDATFLHNEKATPNEFIICNIREEDCSVVILIKDK